MKAFFTVDRESRELRLRLRIVCKLASWYYSMDTKSPQGLLPNSCVKAHISVICNCRKYHVPASHNVISTYLLPGSSDCKESRRKTAFVSALGVWPGNADRQLLMFRLYGSR